MGPTLGPVATCYKPSFKTITKPTEIGVTLAPPFWQTAEHCHREFDSDRWRKMFSSWYKYNA